MYVEASGQLLMFPPPEKGSQYETEAWRDFWEYDAANPHIWEEFVEQSDKAWDDGYRRVGAHFIMHIIRWKTPIRANTGEYKVNNNHFPYYARKYLDIYPEKEGLFELRPLTRR